MQTVCPECKAPNPSGEDICSQCGASLAMAGPAAQGEAGRRREGDRIRAWWISFAVFAGICLAGLMVSALLRPLTLALTGPETPVLAAQHVWLQEPDATRPPPTLPPTEMPALPVPTEPAASAEEQVVVTSPTPTTKPAQTKMSTPEVVSITALDTPALQIVSTAVPDTPAPTDTAGPQILLPTATPAATAASTPQIAVASAVNDTPKPKEQPERPVAGASLPVRIGAPVQAGRWQLTVTAVRWLGTLSWQAWSREAQGVWAVLLLDVQNLGSEAMPFDRGWWVLREGGGATYPESSTAYAAWEFRDRDTAYTLLQPGQRAQLVMAFDVAREVRGLTLYSEKLGRAIVAIGDAQPAQEP